MTDIRHALRSLTSRFTASWGRLSATQQLTLRGLGIVAAVVLLGGIAGAGGPRAVEASDDAQGYTGTAAHSEYRLLRQSFDLTAGDLELARLELQRVQTILELAKEYGAPVGLAELTYDAALREGIDPEFAFRLVNLESQFNPRARSHAEAIGLAQVQLGTARFYDPDIQQEELHDPATNLRIGLRFLRDLIGVYGDVELALLAYNWGPSRLQELLDQGRDPRDGYASSLLNGYGGMK